jgi:chitin disaccharide deacetylase
MATVNNNLPFILCADDYAQSESIDEAILDLASKGRISAISCITSSPRWPQAAKKLIALREKVDIGLHFNLTHGPLLQKKFSAMSLNTCLLKSHLRLLPEDLLRLELQSQWHEFAKQLSAEPDFIDGHQHVHVLPQVQPIFLQQLQQLDPDHKAYVRLPYSKVISKLLSGQVKSSTIAAVGGCRLRSSLDAAKRRYNPAFAGAYNFQAADYAPLFRQFIADLRQQGQPYGLVMCHPGKGGDSDDAISSARAKEWQYFASEQFLIDCRQAGVVLSRMQDE